ncbi:MAG: hypothetical protein DMG68_21620 [Acidobacteria bacterium]|nr:MAG: hypothetical protein DMG68_21620 [Acidobacteriota bacterium]
MNPESSLYLSFARFRASEVVAVLFLLFQDFIQLRDQLQQPFGIMLFAGCFRQLSPIFRSPSLTGLKWSAAAFQVTAGNMPTP